MMGIDQPFLLPSWQRRAMYSLLFVAMLANILVLVFAFSNYSERRDIEAEIRKSATPESIDLLMLKLRSATDVVRRIREARCTQRDALMLYRVATMPMREHMRELYSVTVALREEVTKLVVRRKDVVDLDRTLKALRDDLGLPLPASIVFRADVSAEDRGQVLRELDVTGKEYHARLTDALKRNPDMWSLFDQLRPDWVAVKRVQTASADDQGLGMLPPREGQTASPETLLKTMQAQDKRLFDFLVISKLEDALKDLKGELKTLGLDDQRRLDLLLRRALADNVLAQEEDGVVTDLVTKLAHDRDQEQILRELNCKPLDRQAALDAMKRFKVKFTELDEPSGAGEPARAGAASMVAWPSPSLGSMFVRMPTSQQSLVIALAFGTLGGLCLQSLRLSRRGYWGTVSDPTWGELTMSVMLGGAAAMIVYLLASIGLLIVSDGGNASRDLSTVGAGFVGLLGFVSGLLNDEAFGRIRRFGLQLFREEVGNRVDLPITGPDAELVERLRALGCDRFAELAVVHRLGERLVGKEHFTLFVPTDKAFRDKPLQEWLDLTNVNKTQPLEDLLKAHLHEAAALDRNALDQLAAAGTPVEMADGKKRIVAKSAPGARPTIDGVALPFDTARPWRRGMLHVLDDRLP